MSIAKFIKNKFLNKQLCISFGNDMETITYEQVWALNKEYFNGIIVNVDLESGIIEMDIENVGIIYFNSNGIEYFWEPTFDIRKAARATITTLPAGIRKKKGNDTV